MHFSTYNLIYISLILKRTKVLEDSVLPGCASHCGHLIQSSVLAWYPKGQFRIESSISKDGLYTLSSKPRRESLSFSENTDIIQVRERTDGGFFLRFTKIMKASWLLIRNNFMHFLPDWNYKVQNSTDGLSFFFFNYNGGKLNIIWTISCEIKQKGSVANGLF